MSVVIFTEIRLDPLRKIGLSTVVNICRHIPLLLKTILAVLTRVTLTHFEILKFLGNNFNCSYIEHKFLKF